MESFGRDSTAPGGSPIGEVLARSDFAEGVPAMIEYHGGEWMVKDGVLMQSAKSDDVSLASVKVGGETNYRVQARVKMLDTSPGATAGIVGRIQRDGSCYMLCLHVRSDGRKVIQLRRSEADHITYNVNPRAPLFNDPCMKKGSTLVGDNCFIDNIHIDEWHLLTLDCHGGNFVGYLDGSPTLNAAFWWCEPRGRAPEPWVIGPVGLCTQRSGAQFDDLSVWHLIIDSHMATPTRGLYDARGRLLPCRPYAGFLERMMEYELNVKRNVLMVPAKGTIKQERLLCSEDLEVTPHGVKDTEGHVWPSYCVSI